MSTKQPSQSGERPAADAAPDSAEQPFDPSHFGRHEFPAGLREELIKAEKPRIDPKFLQDTVPPNRKPVLTEPEPIATTPRGGFAAPKTSTSTVDRDARTLLAVPAKVGSPAAATDSPSAPPVDTSRTDPTLMLPSVRKPADKRMLVVGIVATSALLTLVGLLLSYTRSDPPTDVAPSAAPGAATQPATKSPTVSPPSGTATHVKASPANVNSSGPKAVAPAPAAAGAPKQKTTTDAAVMPASPAAPPKAREAAKPGQAPPKTRPGFDPSKPWEED